ncbi:hypothetical protein DFH07DRAFT_952343 [Mycena maculata]|uniref:Uncharacterized protein n=1 Tax=Mycena maculata TaxID=230809 RepID=A0AAD7JYI7_9AGAR|nr:hypothetical protein DFH07DRAFT_952343 [Mycena maculata]
MTNSRTQVMPVPAVAASQPSGILVLGIPFIVFPLATPAYVAVAPPVMAPATPAPAAVVTPAPPTAAPPAPSDTASTPATTAPALRTPAGTGLPAPLVALLRTAGPYRANEVYSVVPEEPLGPIDEELAAPEWYAITRGRFVGVVDQFALSAVAISGVAHAARKAYTTQGLALDAFNPALIWGSVQVV